VSIGIDLALAGEHECPGEARLRVRAALVDMDRDNRSTTPFFGRTLCAIPRGG
jgi:hypothetical protein